MKKSTWALSAGLSLLVMGQSASAEPWVFEPGNVYQQAKTVFEIREDYNFGSPSVVNLETKTEYGTHSVDCRALGVDPCFESLLDASTPRSEQPIGFEVLRFSLAMPVCETDASDWCISDVRLYRAGEQQVSAKLIRSVEGNTTPAVESHGVPEGGTTSLWEAGPGSGFEGLKVAVFGSAEFRNLEVDRPSSQAPSRGKNYLAYEFAMQVEPYVQGDPGRGVPPMGFTPLSTSPGVGNWYRPFRPCVWEDKQGCGVKIDHPEGLRIGLTIRSKPPIGKFFNGRVSDPALNVTKDGSATVLELDANPISVPQVAVVFDNASGLREKLGFTREGTQFHMTKPYYEPALKSLDVLREHTGDAASGQNTFWRVAAIGSDLGNPCYQDYGVAGMVFTNATTFEGMAPPQFKDGFLNYKVAGMHYLPDGKTEFEGTYDLLLKSEVARCLYRYSNAPVSANVTVVGTSGEQKVASTVVSEKDGWLKLAAYGFTFSENKIQVRLSQPKAKVLAKFIGRTTTLTSKQQGEVRTLLATTNANKSVTCSGAFRKLSDRQLALARAKATCALAKKVDPQRTYEIAAVPVTSSLSDAKVTVSTK
ncbi:MAG: hypothetical protein RL696_431 [Actinomycetota bacterium]